MLRICYRSKDVIERCDILLSVYKSNYNNYVISKNKCISKYLIPKLFSIIIDSTDLIKQCVSTCLKKFSSRVKIFFLSANLCLQKLFQLQIRPRATFFFVHEQKWSRFAALSFNHALISNLQCGTVRMIHKGATRGYMSARFMIIVR